MAQHFVPKRTYFAVFTALIILTATTVGVAFIDLGVYNNVAALGIAIVKASLVVLYFMHVRYSNKLTWVFVATGFLFLLILLIFLMGDVSTRDVLYTPHSWSPQTVAE